MWWFCFRTRDCLQSDTHGPLNDLLRTININTWLQVRLYMTGYIGKSVLLLYWQMTLRDGNYLIFKDAPKIETIKAGLKYIDINVLRRFSVILHCNGISSHFNIRRSLSSDSYINKSTAKHFTNLGHETFVYLLSPNLSISQGT